MPQPPSDLPITLRSSPAWWQRIVPDLGARELEDPPLRAELYSADQMAAHGERLAATHVLSDAPLPDRLLARLADNERVLIGAAKQLAIAADADRRHTPAAEWLLDNFYLIEEEVRTARRHLPRGYSREAAAPGTRRRQRQWRRTAARLRPRAAGDRARRRPGRPRPADPLRRRVPVEAAAPPRRAVGAADHAAPGADREPAPRRRARSRSRTSSAAPQGPGPTAWSRSPKARRAT